MMLSCKEVIQKVASDRFSAAGPWERFWIRLHLFLCRHCRSYEGQLRDIDRSQYIWRGRIQQYGPFAWTSPIPPYELGQGGKFWRTVPEDGRPDPISALELPKRRGVCLHKATENPVFLTLHGEEGT